VVLLGWLAAAWQVSLGFSLGLPFLYLICALGLGCLLWRRTRAVLADRSVLVASLAGTSILALVSVLLAIPYLRVEHTFPGSMRSLTVVRFYSPPLSGLLSAPSHERLWGGLTAGLRAHLTAPAEQTLFPGATILVLALVGLTSSAASRRVRLGLVLAATVATVFALGLHGPLGGLAYRAVFHLPGVSGIRTPGRLITYTTLALALLGALGAQRVLAFAAARGSARRGLALVAGALTAAIVLEGSGTLPRAAVLPAPASMSSLAGPLLVLPSNDFTDSEYMPWTASTFQPIVNGTGGFIPSQQARFRSATRAFPAQGAVAWLRTHGVHTVIVDRYYAPGDPASLVVGYDPAQPVPDADAILSTRRALPSGVTRREDGRYTIFTL
jgi:hypothetical protein